MTVLSIRKFPNILYHVIFWIGYFLLFGYIWADNGEFRSSYLLEFILLPVRIGAVYFSVYYLIPQYLENRSYGKFILYYLLSILLFGVLQQVFIHFFFEAKSLGTLLQALAPEKVLRACVLINSTVIFLSAVKILLLYQKEKEKKAKHGDSKHLFLKSDKRIHRIKEDEIIYLEGMGNYVTYHLEGNQNIICYNSLKESLLELDQNFLRIHKSYIINRNHVKSYNMEGIEMSNGKVLPIGFSFKDEVENKMILT